MGKRTSIAIDARMINDSGIGTYLRSLLPYIIEKFDVTLLGDKEKLSSYKTEVIEFNSKIYSIKEQLLFCEKVPACDIFWSPHYNIPYFSIKSKKRIVTIHDLNHIARKNTYSIAARIYSNLVMKKALSASDHIITVSNFSKNEMGRFFKVEKPVSVIYNGVDNKLFNTNTNDFENIKRKYKLPASYFLYTGNMKPHKNIDGLIKAYSIYRMKYKSEIPLLIAGKKDGFRQGQNNFSSLLINENLIYGRDVIVHSDLEFKDLPAIYGNAKMFLFLSHYEGFGLPVIEAQACGCPVICSDKTSLPEIGKNSVVITKPDRPEDTADAMNIILKDSTLSKYLITNGFNNVKRFSWKESAEQHIKTIEAVNAA